MVEPTQFLGMQSILTIFQNKKGKKKQLKTPKKQKTLVFIDKDPLITIITDMDDFSCFEIVA